MTKERVYKMESWFVGVDIGQKGAIACIDDSENLIGVWDIPTLIVKKTVGKKVKRKTKYNIPEIHNIFPKSNAEIGIHCFIEEALTIMGNFTIKTSVSLSHCQGIFEGVAFAHSSHVQTIKPQKWQSYFGISGKKGDTGDQSIKIAKDLYPTVEFKTPRGRVLDGRADAMLLALYGKRLGSK